MLRTDSVPAPADSVTPLADHDDPGPTVASTQMVPPSALTWIFSPAPSVPVNVPLTVCDATLVMKSPAAPVSALSAVTVATAARPAGLQRIAVAGARRGIAGGVNTLHQQRAGARRQRHPARRPGRPRACRRIHPGGAAIGAHLDLLARSQRTRERAAHRLRRHTGDKVPGRASVGTQRRHRRNRRSAAWRRR